MEEALKHVLYLKEKDRQHELQWGWKVDYYKQPLKWDGVVEWDKTDSFYAAVDYYDYDDSLLSKHSPKTETGRVNLCAFWHRGITIP